MARERQELILDPTLEYFLGTADAVVKTSDSITSFEGAIKIAREEKSQKLADLNSQPLPKGVSKRFSVEVIEQTCKQKVKDNSILLNGAKKELNVGLNKTILDFFSYSNCQTPDGKPLILSDFSRLIGRAKEYDLEATTRFLQIFSGHLKEASDYNLFRQYSYRKSKDLIATTEDCQILKTALDLSMKTDDVEMNQLADAYFQFLRHKVSIFRNSFMESYPYLGLVYDIYTTGFFSGDTRTINEAGQIVESHLGDLASSLLVKDEIDKSMMLTEKRYEKILRIKDFKNLPLKQELKDLITSCEMRLSCLSTLYASNESKLFVVRGNKVLKQIFEQTRNWGVLAAVKSSYSQIDARLDILNFIKDVGTVDAMLESGITSDLSYFIEGIYNRSVDTQLKLSIGSEVSFQVSTSSQRVENEKTADKVSKLKTSLERLKGAPKERVYNFFLSYYLSEFVGEKVDAERLLKENDFLWQEVLDNSVWFVSPRGDRFSVKTDTGFAEMAIEYATYEVDRTHPREHRVKVKIEPSPMIFEFWLTKDRNILIDKHTSWVVNPGYKQFFVNLLLRRLYYITSGVLKEELQKPPKDLEGEGGRIFEFKRAHYNTLRAERYTMQSSGAKKHAQEILEIYGIDIYKEMNRRWEIGKLDRRYHLTFTREVARGIAEQPNEIVYKPELLKI